MTEGYITEEIVYSKNFHNEYLEFEGIQNQMDSNKNHICNSILMAEDNLSIMRLYKRNLKKLNVPLHDFSNGQEC